jgi:hypothetical protein
MPKIWIAFLMMAPCLFAQGSEKNCKEVGGAVLTNFLPTPEQGTKGTTLGTATGDLRGGLGVDVLTIKPGPNGTTVYHVQHHWVTETGDTIFLKDAELTTFPTSISGLVALRYIDGVTITGGTGRFAEASGTLAVFGAIDLNHGQLILRYQGEICFAQPEH